MAEPGTYDIAIYQGDTFRISFQMLSPDSAPIDLTGYTPKMQLRDAPNPAGALIATFAVALATQSGATLGQVDIVLSTTLSTALDPTLKYWYDFQLTDPGGGIDTYVKGQAFVTPQVTI